LQVSACQSVSKMMPFIRVWKLFWEVEVEKRNERKKKERNNNHISFFPSL
jgi:hypothetical protein